MRGEWRQRLLAASAVTLMFAGVSAAQQNTSNDIKLMAATQPVAAAAAPADPLEKLKNPAPWFTWGADARIRNEYLNNHFTLSNDLPNHEADWLRFRERVWASITPSEQFQVNIRLVSEPRYIFEPTVQRGWPEADIIFDLLNLKISKPFDLPVTATLGRQEIIFGDGWLVLEGTPLDGSRSIFFDAARFTIDLKPQHTLVDLIYIQQNAETDDFIPPLYNVDGFLREQDERGAIVYVTNKSIAQTQIDGYFIYKHNEAVLPNGDGGEIYTFGSRAAHDFDEHWKARVEGAYQFGDVNSARLQAWGLNSRVSYGFNDAMKNQLRVSYEYLSGNDPDTGANEAFHPVWGRWPQWSELLVYTWATETRIAEVTNLQRLSVGWQANPTEAITLSTDYSLVFANENTLKASPAFGNDDLFRGQLLQAVLRYKINKHVSGNLWGEVFFPGGYYDGRDDPAAYLRAEIVFAL